jgi:phage-related protein (TIGR01555 family)
MKKPKAQRKAQQPKTQPQQTVKMDGVENVITGLGRIGRDASTSTFFTGDLMLDQKKLESLYSSSGIARRIIDLLPDESLKKGIECDKALYDELERLNAFKYILELAKDARLYGGAIMLVIAKDGVSDLIEPLREASLQSIDKLAVFDRHTCVLSATDYDNDPMSPTFGEVATYNLYLRSGKYLKVHASRVIRMDGERLPSKPFQQNNYWHASTLQSVHQSLLSYLSAQGFSDTIIKEWSLTILKVQGLFDAYKTGTESVIAKRLQDADVSKSVMNMLLMDAEHEEFERQFSQVTGYADLMLRTMELVSANSGIPMTKLFGRSPEGMNATGEGDQKQWGAVVQSYQMQSLQPAINRLVYLLSLQSEWTEKPDDLSWNFPSVTTLDDLELAEIRYKNAQADALYMAQGAIDPTYLWHIRHEGGYNVNPSYSLESLEEYESETMGRMEETPQTSESV